MKNTSPDVCPVCGADVPPASPACPECGADDKTGWNDATAVYDGLDLPDDNFNYVEYVKREFGDGLNPQTRPGKAWPWLLIAGVVLGTLVLGFFLR
jgi:hypothetical protein